MRDELLNQYLIESVYQSLLLHPSSLIPHPSSLIPHPSSLIPHPFEVRRDAWRARDRVRVY